MSNETKNRLRELLGEEEFARFQKEGCASVAREKVTEHGCQCSVTDFRTGIQEHYSEFIVIGFKPITEDEEEEGIEMGVRAACNLLQLHEATRRLCKIAAETMQEATPEIQAAVMMEYFKEKVEELFHLENKNKEG